MSLYTVRNFDTSENAFNCTFIYMQKEKTFSCKSLSDVQISYSDIGKVKYENNELTKCGIWYFLCIPFGIYLLKVNNRNTRTRCERCSKLTIKTPERRQ